MSGQTLRLMNRGYTGTEIAERIEMPPEESARRYVECIGGTDAVVAKAEGYARRGDLRFAGELQNHAVFADGHVDGSRRTA